MATSDASVSANNALQTGIDIPTVTTTTKTQFVGYDGKVLHSTVDANGKPVRIHKVITTTVTETCYGEDLSALHAGRTAEEKFVEHVKELGTDTKDVLLQTAAGVQHALESAGDYIRTQMASTSAEHAEKSAGKENQDLLHQAAILKDAIVQKAIDVKDATVDVLKGLATPTEEQAKAVHFSQGTTGVVTEKQLEPIKIVE